ncbi:MAG: hypothetical protein IPF99_01030 [Deltaproteobacteria bacterium]|nr:hypothetical protein [Deltaproteobacteria bacterium]
MWSQRLGGLAAVVLSLASATAEARTVRDEPYSMETTWNAAVRLVRIDMGMPILERDQDMGFFTFTYREGARSVQGSVEMVRTEVDGRPGARVIVQIPQMPTYVESLILTRLARKLRSEFGEPPPPVVRRPAPPPTERAPDRRPGDPEPPVTQPPTGNTPPSGSAPQEPPNNNRREQSINPAGPEV